MTTTVFMNGRSQAVRLRKEFQLDGRIVSARRLGDGIILEPLKETSWPERYFEDILVTDQALTRLEQGTLPPSPSLDF